MKTKEAENNHGRRVRFKIVGKGGVSLEQRFRKSNPWKGEKCGRPLCFPCRGSRGGDCWREGVCYTLWCEECGENVAAYKGETGRNSYTRGVEQLTALNNENEEKSVLWLHSVFHHNRREDVEYQMRVTSSHTCPMDRQCTEQVDISYFEGPVLMNRKTELGGVRVERQKYRRWGTNI